MDLPIQLYFYLEWGILKGELPHSGTREAILLRFVFSPLSGVLLVRFLPTRAENEHKTNTPLNCNLSRKKRQSFALPFNNTYLNQP